MSKMAYFCSLILTLKINEIKNKKQQKDIKAIFLDIFSESYVYITFMVSFETAVDFSQ